MLYSGPVPGANVRQALEEAVAELPSGLGDHVTRVVVEARGLAERHDIDIDRAAIAALGHDLARAIKPPELLRRAEDAGLDPSAIERSEPILLHGALSATLMAERFGIEDAEVLAAARYHTTARADMSALERLIYVADKTEPGKVRDRTELLEARRLADESLESSMLRLLDAQIAKALARGWPLHPDTTAARNELLRRT